MGVVQRGGSEEYRLYPPAPPGTACYYCHTLIDPGQRHVYWMGAIDLWLHGKCSEELGVRLIRDGWNAWRPQ